MFVARNGSVAVYHNESGPYEAYSGDMYACPECHANVIIGFGRSPIWTHFESEDALFTLKKMEEGAKKHNLPFIHVR